MRNPFARRNRAHDQRPADPFLRPADIPARDLPAARLSARTWTHTRDLAVRYDTADGSDVLAMSVYTDPAGRTAYVGREFELADEAQPGHLFAPSAGFQMVNNTEQLLSAVRAQDEHACAVFGAFSTSFTDEELLPPVTMFLADSTVIAPGNGRLDVARYSDPCWVRLSFETLAGLLGQMPWLYEPGTSVQDAYERIPNFRTLAQEHRLGANTVGEVNAVTLRDLGLAGLLRDDAEDERER